MKKVILLTACTVAVLLSGCSDNELASVGDGIGTSTQSAIGFHVVGNQAETRATIIDAGNITSTDFKVYAFTDNGNAYMGSNDTKWVGTESTSNMMVKNGIMPRLQMFATGRKQLHLIFMQ